MWYSSLDLKSAKLDPLTVKKDSRSFKNEVIILTRKVGKPSIRISCRDASNAFSMSTRVIAVDLSLLNRSESFHDKKNFLCGGICGAEFKLLRFQYFLRLVAKL